MLENTCIPALRKKIMESMGEDIKAEALAKEFGMSLSSLRRYWKRYHGNETFMMYRNRHFLHESSRLLVETKLTIKEIAERLNFADAFYFSKKFRQLSGLSPVEYRKKYRVL